LESWAITVFLVGLLGLCFDDDASGGAKEEYLPRRGL
jgi:hypothetical protein